MEENGPAVDIRALAALSRVAVSDEEVTKLERELPSILAFVETIQTVDIAGPATDAALHNVMRKDENPHERGIYTEKLLSAAPHASGNRIVVKQVISRKK